MEFVRTALVILNMSVAFVFAMMVTLPLMVSAKDFHVPTSTTFTTRFPKAASAKAHWFGCEESVSTLSAVEQTSTGVELSVSATTATRESTELA